MPVRNRLLYSQFVFHRILPLVIAVLLTAACGRHPGVYAAPPQRSIELGPDPDSARPFVKMDDPDADDFLVRDISPGRDFRRWAFVHPELRFKLKDISHLNFAAEFAIPEVTYKVTGPVTVTYAVNGRAIGTLKCSHPGDFQISTPVPAGLVEAEKSISVTFEATPRWVSPDDGAQLSFLLRSAGFTH